MTQSSGFCGACGAALQLGPELRFCPSCGQPVAQAPDTPTPSGPPSQEAPAYSQTPVTPYATSPVRQGSKARFWVLGCIGGLVALVLILMVAVGAYTWYVASSGKASDRETEALFRSMEGTWTLVEGEGTEQYTPEQRRYRLKVQNSAPSVSQKHPYELKGEASLGSFTLEDVEEGEIVGGMLCNDNFIQDDFGIYAIRATASSDRLTLTMNLTYQVGDGTTKRRRFVLKRDSGPRE